MMMCVQLDMKEEFDRIWKWSRTYMYMDQGENEGYFAWSCKPSGEKNALGPAPDGEEYYAMALFFASHRWGDGEGIYAYSKEARKKLPVDLLLAFSNLRKDIAVYPCAKGSHFHSPFPYAEAFGQILQIHKMRNNSYSSEVLFAAKPGNSSGCIW